MCQSLLSYTPQRCAVDCMSFRSIKLFKNIIRVICIRSMPFQLDFHDNSLLFRPPLTSSFPHLFPSYLQELISCLYHEKTIHWVCFLNNASTDSTWKWAGFLPVNKKTCLRQMDLIKGKDTLRLQTDSLCGSAASLMSNPLL